MSIKENEKLPKDHKLAKEAKSMTTGVTKSGIEQYERIVLHGAHLIKVIVSDGSETIAEYENGAQRVFSTFDLASYRELGIFPTGAAFHRRTANGIESLFIEIANMDTYVVEKVVLGKSVTETISYADLMAWHDGGEKVDPSISLVPGTHLYVPKTSVPLAEAKDADETDDESNPFETELKERIEQLQAEPEALQFGQALIDDLRAKLDAANKELQQQSIEADQNIDFLQRELLEAKALISKQKQMHETVIAAYEEDAKRLEAKAAILTSVCKEYLMRQNLTESDLNKLAKEGWQIQHMQYMTDVDFSGQLWVVLVRDLPAAPAPKVTVTDAAIYSTYNPPPVVQRPPVPMPANQTIIHQPAVSRALTNNGPKPGETKRIPTLAEIQARREKDNAEIGAIMQRGLEEQETLRRQFAQSTSPFNRVGAQ